VKQDAKAVCSSPKIPQEVHKVTSRRPIRRTEGNLGGTRIDRDTATKVKRKGQDYRGARLLRPASHAMLPVCLLSYVWQVLISGLSYMPSRKAIELLNQVRPPRKTDQIWGIWEDMAAFRERRLSYRQIANLPSTALRHTDLGGSVDECVFCAPGAN
jgi:hypothetical protein